jgi:outer membrane protein
VKNLSIRTLAVLSLLSVCAVFAPAPARAQDLKVGVLDYKLVIERSTAIREMIAKAEAPLQQQKSKIDVKIEEFRRQRERLEARRSVLSPDQFAQEQRGLDALREEIQDMQHEVNKQYERLDKEVMQPAVDRILEIVQQVARDEKFDLVIDSATVLFRSERLDLTPIVIQTLDRQAALAPLGKPADARAGAAQPVGPSDTTAPRAAAPTEP